MVKRPLSLVCLAAAILLYLYVRFNGVPYIDNSAFQGRMITVTGKVYKKETAMQANGPVTVLYLKLSETEDTGWQKNNDNPAGKKVICYLKEGQPEVEMGSYVQLQGKLQCFERASNPGQFDAYSYYLISGISYRLNQAEIKAKTIKYNKLAQELYRLRVFFSEKLKESLPEKEASIMQTMLLGEKGSMDKELKALYQRNGIAHILAISGLHVSMLGMGLYKILRKCGIPMKAAAGMAAFCMILYGSMTGFSVSALRAVFMFVIHMAAIILERTYDLLTAVAVAAALLLIQQPLYFLHSGFVFSFGCVLGIGLLLPLLTQAVKEKNFIIRSFTFGAGMAVITLPIYLWFYYQYPVCSILLNLIVVPLMSLLMAAGLLLILCQTIFPPFSLPFVLLVKGVLKLYDVLLNLCNGFPGSILTVGRPSKWQIILYLLVLVFIVLLGKRLKVFVRWCIVLLALAVLLYHPHKEMEITFLDVGQGDSIFIANDNENCYLVDGGSSSVSHVGEYRIIPFLKYQGISCIEAVFITHPDEDHCNGIEELIKSGQEQGIRMEHLVLPAVAQESKEQAYLELEQMAASEDIPVTYISRGQEITDDRLKLTCLHPDEGESAAEANEYSIVLKITYGNFSAMLTGDVEGSGEQKLIRNLETEDKGCRLTVLKAAHHGSGYSTPDEFLDCLYPVYTVISCGRDNSYGHPHEELQKRIKEHGSKQFITYETGAVTFCTDGQKVKIKKFLDG